MVSMRSFSRRCGLSSIGRSNIKRYLDRNHYVLDLDGNIIATDDYSLEYDLQSGEEYLILQETIDFILAEKARFMI